VKNGATHRVTMAPCAVHVRDMERCPH
jgi:hypothetical protein